MCHVPFADSHAAHLLLTCEPHQLIVEPANGLLVTTAGISEGTVFNSSNSDASASDTPSGSGVWWAAMDLSSPEICGAGLQSILGPAFSIGSKVHFHNHFCINH